MGRFVRMVVLLLSVPLAVHAGKFEEYYAIRGDATLVGLFSAHSDGNCRNISGSGLRQMSNVITAVRAVNAVKYVPGVKMGLSLYDVCDSPLLAQKAILSSMTGPECEIPRNMGIVTTLALEEAVKNLTDTLNVTVHTIDVAKDGDLSKCFDVAMDLLKKFNVSVVDLVIMPTKDVSDAFSEAAYDGNVCILSSVTFSEFDGECPGSNLIVIVGVTSDQVTSLELIRESCAVNFFILILAEDVDSALITDNFSSLEEAYLVVPSTVWVEFAIPVDERLETFSNIVQQNINDSNVTTDFVRTAAAVVDAADEFKTRLEAECFVGSSVLLGEKRESAGKHDLCANLSEFRTPPELLELYKNSVSFLILTIGPLGVQYAGEVKNGELRLAFNATAFGDRNGTCVSDCDCINNGRYRLWLKSESWVASVGTICAIGLCSCASVFIFYAVRLYKRDILEGNPAFSIFLTTAAMACYLSALPFCFTSQYPQWQTWLCWLKYAGPSFSYCAVFSTMLSRCLMLLACEAEASFMSHVNGYLQCCLCFFILAFQAGFLGQFFVFAWLLREGGACEKFQRDKYLYLSSVYYDGALLVALLCCVWFAATSKRNYREGLRFACATTTCAGSWIAWCTAFLALPQQWWDCCLACGLCATASCVVICILVPKTYMIMNGVVRDECANFAPANGNANTSGGAGCTEAKYRSTQALYDTVRADRCREGGYYDGPALVASPQGSNFDIRVEDVGTNEIRSLERYGSRVSGGSRVTRF